MRLRTQQGLDRATRVHRPVALRHLVERQGQIKDFPRIDLPVPDEIDEVREITAHGSRPTEQANVGIKERLAIQGDAVRNADIPDGPAGPGGAYRLHHRLLRADALED